MTDLIDLTTVSPKGPPTAMPTGGGALPDFVVTIASLTGQPPVVAPVRQVAAEGGKDLPDGEILADNDGDDSGQDGNPDLLAIAGLIWPNPAPIVATVPSSPAETLRTAVPPVLASPAPTLGPPPELPVGPTSPPPLPLSAAAAEPTIQPASPGLDTAPPILPGDGASLHANRQPTSLAPAPSVARTSAPITVAVLAASRVEAPPLAAPSLDGPRIQAKPIATGSDQSPRINASPSPVDLIAGEAARPAGQLFASRLLLVDRRRFVTHQAQGQRPQLARRRDATAD